MSSKVVQIRQQLLALLGGKCVRCGTTSFLEFDHPNGRAYHPRRLSHLQRMRRYRRDAKKGLLRLLCKSHNSIDGANKRWGNR